MGFEPPSGCRGLRAAAAALKKAGIQILFQLPDARTHGGLGDIQPLSGAIEIPRFQHIQIGQQQQAVHLIDLFD